MLPDLRVVAACLRLAMCCALGHVSRRPGGVGAARGKHSWTRRARARPAAALLKPHSVSRADPAEWEEVAARPFVDAARSRSTLARALYLPRLSRSRNHWVHYTLLRRMERPRGCHADGDHAGGRHAGAAEDRQAV